MWGRGHPARLSGKVYDLQSRGQGFEIFVGVSFGKTIQNPSLVLEKPRKYMNM